jgi:flagellar basal body P-ring protein FlgI
MAAEKEVTRTYPAGRDVVYPALVRAMTNVGGVKIKQTDNERGIVEARTGVTIWSWGENLEAWVATLAPDATAVTVKIGLKVGLVGWGQQQRVANKILDALEMELARAERA